MYGRVYVSVVEALGLLLVFVYLNLRNAKYVPFSVFCNHSILVP